MDISAKEILKKYWGFSDFRFPQNLIIKSVLDKKDTLAILPTGGGKSLCFQLPILLQNGLCLVVSPLIALMKDQVESLKRKGIKAEIISSELSSSDIEIILDNCRFGGIKLLYISPERLGSERFIALASSLNVSYIAVDEAHCISEWGHDFRPAYLELNKLRNIFPNASILALTATATPKIQKEIIQLLELDNPEVFKTSLYRKNLAYRVLSTEDKYGDLVDILNKNSGAKIVFCKSRKETYQLSKFLNEQGFDSDFFHARISVENKNRKQKEFIESDNKILCSTNAFGMGIDKPDIRLVVHMNAPICIESYIQEVGRAGRDGKYAAGILLHSEKDKEKAFKFFKSATTSRKEFVTIIHKLYNQFQVADFEHSLQQFAFSERKFREKYKFSKRKVRSVLHFLQQQKIIDIQSTQKRSLAKINVKNFDINDNNKNKEDKVLSYLARNFGGIFQDAINIDEIAIAYSLNMSKSDLKRTLNSLNQLNKIFYRDAAIVKISFLTAREDNYIKNILWKTYLSYQEAKWKRLNDIYFFAENNQICKSKLLLRYFGEKHTANCGICSICKTLDSEAVNPKEILNFISKKTVNFSEINKEFKACKKEDLCEVLQSLLDEGKIKLTLPDIYSL